MDVFSSATTAAPKYRYNAKKVALPIIEERPLNKLSIQAELI